KAPDLLLPLQWAKVKMSRHTNIHSRANGSNQMESVLPNIWVFPIGCLEVAKSSTAFYKRSKAVYTIEISAAGKETVFFSAISVQQSTPCAFKAEAGMGTNIKIVPAINTDAIHVSGWIGPVIGIQPGIFRSHIQLARPFFAGTHNLTKERRI